MDTEMLGAELAHAIIGWADQKRKAVRELAGEDRDPDTVDANFVALLWWLATRKARECLRARSARRVVEAMKAHVWEHLANRPGVHQEAEGLLASRSAGYESAFGEGSEQSVIQIGNYFLACCATKRIAVRFDEIVPDPEHLAEAPEIVTPGTIEALRELRDTKGFVPYPMDPLKSLGLWEHISPFAQAVEELLAESQ
jgi:hypothetical protein